jgi:hypothetical protein
VLAVLGSPLPAAPAHRPIAARTLVAGASGAFDHVPPAAERIAAAFGVVTSTFRSVAHNREVGGVPNSYHLQGRAIDVARRRGIVHAQIAAALRAAGFTLVESLDEGDHSHFAFAPATLGQAASPPVPAAEAPPVRRGPRVAADEHGSLLADSIPAPKVAVQASILKPLGQR